MTSAMLESEALDLFRSLSNVGRWGAADELGTLNLITTEKRLQAVHSIETGRVTPLGRILRPKHDEGGLFGDGGVTMTARWDETAAQDRLVIEAHGFEVTHLDALGHSFHADRAWNDRHIADVVGPSGLRFGAVIGSANGILTRGVLLDVAGSRGVDRLETDDGVSAADLDRAEAFGSVHVEPGDAIFVRTGRDYHTGNGTGPLDVRAGVLPDVLPWLRGRDVALYSGDCVERMPSGYPGLPMPLHQVGMVAMGLWILDNPDIEALALACAAERRSVFALVVAPLRLPGGTASAVNPLALF